MKAHRTDNLSLFFGLLFLLVAGGFGLHKAFDIELPGMGWLIAGGLLLLGGLMAVSALMPSPAAPPEPEVTENSEEPMLAE